MSEKIPETYIISKDRAFTRYGNLIYGAGLIALFAIGPRLRELGEKNNDDTLLIAADVVKASGFAVMATMFISTVASQGLTNGIIYTLALLVDPINILGLEAGALAIDLPGFVIYIIAYITVNYLWCNYVDPESKACGCSPHPGYEKARLELEKNNVNPGEEIHFTIYGMQHCGPTIAGYMPSLLKHVETKGDPTKFLSSCLFEEEYNGRCCEDTYKVYLEEGTYEVYGEVQAITLGGGWKPYTDSQTLTVGTGGVPALTSIPLKQGYNLISAPYNTVTFDTSDCTLFENALHYTTIAGIIYETVNVDDMEGGVGYWVYSYNDCEIELSDYSDPIEAPTEFDAGWNQIAVPLEGLHKDNVQCDQIEDPKTWDTETESWVFVENMVAGKSYFVDCYPEQY